jgi:uncharacterized protein HemX
MSYDFIARPAQRPIPLPLPAQPRRSVPAPLRHGNYVPLAPLAQAPSTGMSPETKKALMVLAVVVVIVAAIWWFSRKRQTQVLARNRAARDRMSTKDLAKRLYERLEKRKGANQATLRSLQHYARRG